MTDAAICRFRGEYHFLSNFYPCLIELRGISYPSAEHVFQAEKSDSREHKIAVAHAITPAVAKRIGRTCVLRPEWNRVRIEYMRAILWEKFSQNGALADRLLDTGNATLIEGNTWGDRFWGVDRAGTGMNHLGRLLMEVREKLQADFDSFYLS